MGSSFGKPLEGEMATGSGTGTPIAQPTSSTAIAPDRSGTLLALDDFRRIIGWNPWHFWGFSNDRHAPTSACNGVVRQYAWQGADAAGRTDVLEAIRVAEDKLRRFLGYSVAPRFEYDEVTWPKHYNTRTNRLWSADAGGRFVAVKVNHGKVRTLGAPKRDFIGNAALSFQDRDADELEEQFTLTIGTTVTNIDELAVYFASTDRYDGSGVSERWRVQPVSITIASGTATITGSKWLVGKPLLGENMTVNDIDPTVSGNFVTQLAVYRYYADTTNQGEFVWESAPGGCIDCTDPSSEHTATARYSLRDANLGWVGGEAATYNADSGAWCPTAWGLVREPARARVAYLAGAPLEYGQMSGQFKAIVARLAAAEMPNRICACDTANKALHQWQFEMSRAAGANDEQYSISPEDLNCPFGTRQGQIWAWKRAKHLVQAGASLA